MTQKPIKMRCKVRGERVREKLTPSGEAIKLAITTGKDTGSKIAPIALGTGVERGAAIK